MSNAKQSEYPEPTLVPTGTDASLETRSRTRRGRRAKRNGNAPDSKPSPRQLVPAPGIPKPCCPSTRTVMLNDTRSNAELFDDDVAMHFPVDIRPRFNMDAAGLFDMVDSCYANLRALEPKLNNNLPFPLFSYYMGQLYWYRAMYVANRNSFKTGYEIDRFLRALDALDLWVPQELHQWLIGLGNTTTAAGDSMHGDVASVPGAPGSASPFTMGRYGAATAYLYASLPAPVVLTGLIQETVRNDQTAQPADDVAWDIASITPTARAGHTWVPTPNLLGWYRVRKSTSRGLRAMLDLGWTSARAPVDSFGSWQLSPATMRYVATVLETLSSKHRMLKFEQDTTIGFNAEVPWLRTSRQMQLDSRSSSLDVEWFSRYNVEPKLVSSSFLLGYRIERDQNQARTESSAYPYMYVADAAADTPLAMPFAIDINANWNAGNAPAYLNGVAFRGPANVRSHALANLSARYNTAQRSAAPAPS